MQRTVVALALAAAVQAFAPPRLVATPAAKSVLPLRSPLRDSALRATHYARGNASVTRTSPHYTRGNASVKRTIPL